MAATSRCIASATPCATRSTASRRSSATRASARPNSDREQNHRQHRPVGRGLDDVLRHEIDEPLRDRRRAGLRRRRPRRPTPLDRAAPSPLPDRSGSAPAPARRSPRSRPTRRQAAPGRRPARARRRGRAHRKHASDPTLATSIDATSGITVIRIRLMKIVPTGATIATIVVAAGDVDPASARPMRKPATRPIRTRVVKRHGAHRTAIFSADCGRRSR